MRSLKYLSLLVFLASVLAWGGVVYASTWLTERATEEGIRAVTAEEQASSAAYRSRLQSLALDTKIDREQLEGYVRSDVVGLASAIEKAGKDMVVRAKVSAALPSGSKDIPGGEPLRSVAFMIQAEGTFSGLVRLVKILEAFPAFSTIEQLEFERTGDPGGASAWRANIRLQVRTTSDITS